MTALILALSIVSGASLVNIMIINGEKYQNDASEQQLYDSLVTAPRGDIYDRNMQKLATSSPAWTVYITPNGIKKLDDKEAEAVNLQSNTSLYFVKDQRPILLSNRQRVAVSQIWTSKSFSNLIEVAAKLGIAVELDKDTDKDVKGTGYVLEYLNGWKPTTPKKGCLGMATLLIVAGGCALFGLMELIYCLTK